MPTKVLSFKDLRERGISYSRVHIHRLVGAGKFPRPIKIGENRTAWLERELDEWLDAKIAERDAQTVGILGVTFDDRKQHKLWAFGACDMTVQERKQRTRAEKRARDQDRDEARRQTSRRQT